MRSPDAVLGSIPGWETATWTEFTAGTNNSSFLLQNNGRRAVLKIDDMPRVAPFNTRRNEFDVQAHAANAALASAPLYADETVYLCDYAEGQVWSVDMLSVSENLQLLADALRKLHALPLSGRMFDASAAAQGYANIVGADNSAEATWHLDRVRNTRGASTRCFCHNDLVAENMLMCDRLRLLDWEYACDNDPLFDLATVIAHHDLDEYRAEILLAAYFGEQFERHKDAILKGLEGQKRLYRSLYWLWNAARS